LYRKSEPSSRAHLSQEPVVRARPAAPSARRRRTTGTTIHQTVQAHGRLHARKYLLYVSNSTASTCCGFIVRLVVTASCTTNAQQIESQQQVRNRSPQQVVRQAASLTTSWTTCRTASPQQVACNNQQVLQQVAQLVVRQIHN